MITDIVIGLQHGDEGKGKVTHHLLKSGEYTHCIRFNGGCNAGHTIYHKGQKFVTHHIPAGVFFGVKTISQKPRRYLEKFLKFVASS